MMLSVALVFASAISITMGTNAWRVKLLMQDTQCREDPKTKVNEAFSEEIRRGEITSEAFLEKVRKGEITTDSTVGAYSICMATNSGLVDSNGKISTTALRSILASFIKDRTELERAFTKCNSEKENPEQTAQTIWICTANAFFPYLDGPRAWKVNILTTEMQCQADPNTKLSKASLEKLRIGAFTYDPNLGAHCICMATKIGLMDSNGKISTTKLRRVLSSFNNDRAELEIAFTTCNSEKKNPEDTALGLWRCTREAISPYWNMLNLISRRHVPINNSQQPELEMEGPLKKLASHASETLGINSNRQRLLDPNQNNTSASAGGDNLNQFVGNV